MPFHKTGNGPVFNFLCLREDVAGLGPLSSHAPRLLRLGQFQIDNGRRQSYGSPKGR